MHDDNFQRCDPADPNRCQASHDDQQCPFLAVFNKDTNKYEKYCKRHGPNDLVMNRDSHRKYMVAKWQEKIGKHANDPQIKNLSEEVGILRLMVETKLEAAQTAEMLMMHSGAITTLINAIVIATEKWHKIEMQTNQVMDRNQAQEFMLAVASIINDQLLQVFSYLEKIPKEHLPTAMPTHASILKSISDGMMEELSRRTNPSVRMNKLAS